jgi:hypothetical protein
VIPEIKNALSELTPILGSAVGELAPALGGALSAVLPLVGKLIKGLVPILTPLLNALGPALDALGPALQPLGEALGQIVVALAPVLPVLGEFLAAVAQLLIPVLLLLALVLKPLTPLFNFMALAIGQFADALAMIDWAAVGSAIGGAFMDAVHAVGDAFMTVANFFVKIPQIIAGGLTAIGAMFGEKIAEIVTHFKEFGGAILATLTGIPGQLFQAGINIVKGLWNGISSLGGWLWQHVKDFVYANTVGAMKTALGIGSPAKVVADQVGKWLPPAIPLGMQQSMPTAAGEVAALVGQLGNSVAAGAASVVTNLGGVIVNVPAGTDVPTAERIGNATGSNVSRVLTRNRVTLAVRMR